MTKQIPLRLEESDLEQLEIIKAHTGDKTANKAMIRLLHRYIPVYKEMREAQQKVVELNIAINKMREHFENMMYHKKELDTLLSVD